MPTYQIPDLSLDGSPVAPRTLAYYSRRLQSEVWDLVVRRFDQLAAENNLTQARLATRLGKDPAVINRLLGAPGNWTLETISDLLVAMAIDPRRLLAALPLEQQQAAERESAEQQRVLIGDAGATQASAAGGYLALGMKETLPHVGQPQRARSQPTLRSFPPERA